MTVVTISAKGIFYAYYSVELLIYEHTASSFKIWSFCLLLPHCVHVGPMLGTEHRDGDVSNHNHDVNYLVMCTHTKAKMVTILDANVFMICNFVMCIPVFKT